MKRTPSVHRGALVAALALVLGPLPGRATDSKADAPNGWVVAPTRGGDLPAAVLGKAPAPLGESVDYFPGDAAASGYLVEPPGEGRFGAVILIHEWNGLVDRVRQVADAVAAEGYVALAADLYSGRTGSNREENLALVRETLGRQDAVEEVHETVGQMIQRSGCRATTLAACRRKPSATRVC